ncbi:MAG: ABC transporter substrate-binding protein [Chloroflexota bacterium]|nr:ABC transporter substrate-binding protein [Chloroflexota bacterium]
MIRRRAAGSILLSGLMIAGFTGGVAAQDEEVSGELTVLCTPQEDWCVKMVEEFENQTGIPTSYVRMSSGESLARLRAGAEAPEFDVWWGGPADGQIAAAAEGLIEPYISPNAAPISDGQKAADGTWTGVYVGALGLCSNQAILDELGVEVPDSWDDLLVPELKGNVAVAHPASSGTAYTTFYTQITRLGGADEGLAFMSELHPNILQYTKSGSAPGGMAGRGEIATAIIFSHDCIKNFEAGFEDLVVSFPSEGTGYEIGAVALVAGAPNPDAGKAWIDWALQADTQEIGPTVGSFQLPTNPDAAVSDLSVSLDQVDLVDYDFDAAGAARTELTQRFEDEVAAKPAE